jgi:hypothetical protein
MIRKFTTFGLAFVSVLAMSAVVASATQAAAGTLTSEGKLVTPTGEQTVEHVFTLTNHEISSGVFATTKCKKATFTSPEPVSEGARTFRVHPVYSECTAFGLLATVTTTGCDYRFWIEEPTEIIVDFPGGTVTNSGAWHVTTDLFCQATKDKDGTETPHRIKIVTATCEVTVWTQTGLTTSAISNSGGSGTAMDLTLSANITGITYSVTKDGIGCPLSGTGVFSGGDYQGTTTFKAHSFATGEAAGITLH